MLKGHLDMIVLAALASGPAHGYAVIQEIRQRSGGAFDLPEGTIYPALHRLEQGGLLSSRWSVGDSGRQRRVYSLTRSGRRALVGKIAMEDVSRAFEKGETDGFMKVLVDAESKQILGASFLGTSGDEAVHCVLDVMYAKAPYTVLQRAVHIHPTVAEFIPTLLGSLAPLAEQSG